MTTSALTTSALTTSALTTIVKILTRYQGFLIMARRNQGATGLGAPTTEPVRRRLSTSVIKTRTALRDLSAKDLLQELQPTNSTLKPHEFLLKIMQGEPIEHKHWDVKRDRLGRELSRELITTEYYATMEQRIDCAKSAAPFYAPKLAVQISTDTTSEKLVQAYLDLSKKLPV